MTKSLHMYLFLLICFNNILIQILQSNSLFSVCCKIWILYYMESFQIQVCLLYEFKLQDKAKGAHVNNAKVFGENAVTIKSIQILDNKF